MLAPPIATWIEQRSDLTSLGINPSEVAPFVQIAVGAGQSQVAEIIVAAVLARDDVLNLQRNERRIGLSVLTIFAAVTRSGPHGGTRGGIHRSRLAGGNAETCFGLQDGQ